MTQDATSRNISGGGDILLEAEIQEDRCPICDGMGWVERRVPLGHPDFGELFPCRCRKKATDHERLQRLRRYSGLTKAMLDRMTFESFETTLCDTDSEERDSLQAAYKYASNFAKTLEGWLLITGDHGNGKTHLAVAIAQQCINKGHPALFTFVPDLLDHLRAAFSPNSPVQYDQLFEQVKSVPLLILDDLGAETSTPWAKEKLYQIAVHRHNGRLPTVITTYLTLDEMEEAHPRLASRLNDTKVVTWAPISVPDYRDNSRIRDKPTNPESSSLPAPRHSERSEESRRPSRRRGI